MVRILAYDNLDLVDQMGSYQQKTDELFTFMSNLKLVKHTFAETEDTKKLMQVYASCSNLLDVLALNTVATESEHLSSFEVQMLNDGVDAACEGMIGDTLSAIGKALVKFLKAIKDFFVNLFTGSKNKAKEAADAVKEDKAAAKEDKPKEAAKAKEDFESKEVTAIHIDTLSEYADGLSTFSKNWMNEVHAAMKKAMTVLHSSDDGGKFAASADLGISLASCPIFKFQKAKQTPDWATIEKPAAHKLKDMANNKDELLKKCEYVSTTGLSAAMAIENSGLTKDIDAMIDEVMKVEVNSQASNVVHTLMRTAQLYFHGFRVLSEAISRDVVKISAAASKA